MNDTEGIALHELRRIVLESASYGEVRPGLSGVTPLDRGGAALTLLEMAEVLVRVEERTGIPLAVDEVSREWFASLKTLARRVREHTHKQSQEV